jgi:hypothetical protein
MRLRSEVPASWLAYTGGQRESTDDDSSEQAGHRARAAAFEGELAFERVEDALDPLAHRAQRAVPRGLFAAIGTDQPGAVTCDELLECLRGVTNRSSSPQGWP